MRFLKWMCESNQKRTCEKVAPVATKITETAEVAWTCQEREEWQMHEYQDRDGEEERKPGGETRVRKAKHIQRYTPITLYPTAPLYKSNHI